MVYQGGGHIPPITVVFYRFSGRKTKKSIFIDNNLVGEGLKSVTFSIVFQSSSKTLEDKDVNSIIDEIIHVADNNFNAKLRA